LGFARIDTITVSMAILGEIKNEQRKTKRKTAYEGMEEDT
jgi:hypothetical protein